MCGMRVMRGWYVCGCRYDRNIVVVDVDYCVKVIGEGIVVVDVVDMVAKCVVIAVMVAIGVMCCMCVVIVVVCACAGGGASVDVVNDIAAG